MPFVSKWTSDGLKVDVTSDQLIRPTDSVFLTFLSLLNTLHSAVPLVEFRLKPVGGQPGTFDYTFKAVDGRDWLQRLKVDPDGRASMTFDVADYWYLEEFVPHREVRNVTVELMKRFGVTKIDVDF